MKRRAVVFGLAAIFILLAIPTILLWKPFFRAKDSADVFQRFATHLEAGEWADVEEMLSPDCNIQINNDRVIAQFSFDITDRIIEADPKWLAMIDHHRSMQNEPKYIFEGGYALVLPQSGLITLVKIP